jgi:hypothetical protein
MEAVCFSETLLDFYMITWRYITEASHLHIHRYGNLKSHFITSGFFTHTAPTISLHFLFMRNSAAMTKKIRLYESTKWIYIKFRTRDLNERFSDKLRFYFIFVVLTPALHEAETELHQFPQQRLNIWLTLYNIFNLHSHSGSVKILGYRLDHQIMYKEKAPAIYTWWY